MATIHPSACVDSSAKLADDVVVGPYAVIYAGAELAAGCEIGPHAVIYGSVRLGQGVKVNAHAVLGGDPQDFSFDPALKTYVEVGAGTVIREGVTLHRATHEGEASRIGEQCLLMAYCHAGHDTVVGNRVVIANNAMLAGHVTVEDFVVFGGGTAVHQNQRVGEGCMISGLSRIAADVPPYTIVSERNVLHGLNLIGLKRRGVPRERIAEIKQFYHELYHEQANLKTLAAEALPRAVSPEARHFLEFFGKSKRGVFCRPFRKAD